MAKRTLNQFTCNLCDKEKEVVASTNAGEHLPQGWLAINKRKEWSDDYAHICDICVAEILKKKNAYCE